MDVLFLNNYYYPRGGAERVFLDEIELLRMHGHTIAGFARKHPRDLETEYAGYFPDSIQTDSTAISWNALKTAKEIVYSRETKRALKKLLEQFRPQIAHAHNIYGRLTTSVLDQLNENGVPTVLTVHDYKLMCPNYKFMKRGSVCEACKGERYYMALLNRCHKNSLPATAVYVLETYLNHWLVKYKKNISLFVTPSTFLRNKLIEHGWPGHRIEHIPNFFQASEFKADSSPGDYFLYFGRLSDEKGIQTLMRAFMVLRGSSIKLLVVGEGPLEVELKSLASSDSRISFTGYLSGERLRDAIRGALAVIVPSEGYENMPMAVLESMACGKPVIGSRIGGIPELIQEGVDGFLFPPGNIEELRCRMDSIAEMPPASVRKMGEDAREKVENEYSAELHYERLMTLYQKVLQ